MRENFTSVEVFIDITVSAVAVSPIENVKDMNGIALK
jgi:hypothetical protein